MRDLRHPDSQWQSAQGHCRGEQGSRSQPSRGPSPHGAGPPPGIPWCAREHVPSGRPRGGGSLGCTQNSNWERQQQVIRLMQPLRSPETAESELVGPGPGRNSVSPGLSSGSCLRSWLRRSRPGSSVALHLLYLGAQARYRAQRGPEGESLPGPPKACRCKGRTEAQGGDRQRPVSPGAFTGHRRGMCPLRLQMSPRACPSTGPGAWINKPPEPRAAGCS